MDILPHQVEAVYRYLLPLPRIRFLLADDTGAGKTIMAGLLIKELLFRQTISKVLIITPGGLTGQWQDEMADKFGLRFNLLFLTATPHRGRKDTFRRLLMLLDDDLFQKDELVTQRIHEATVAYGEAFEAEKKINNARNRFFLRRLKEEMVDWDGRELFKPRHTKTTGYELTPQELELYNAVTKYVRSRRKEAKAKRNRNVELTLMVVQRRLTSSIYAITRTLANRLTALDEVLRILNDPSRTSADKKRLLKGDSEDIPESIEDYEELDEKERADVDKRIFRQVLTDDPDEVRNERAEIEGLRRMAEGLKNHIEAKFSELLSVLDSSNVIRSENEKLVIFTEHRDTMQNLADRLSKKGYTVVTIHGGMDIDARKQAQREFRTRAKILVATDAAGEGINLQFCRFLINWDVPWNPNRLEQRMGRVHRYGQDDDVWVYNLVAINTREGCRG